MPVTVVSHLLSIDAILSLKLGIRPDIIEGGKIVITIQTDKASQDYSHLVIYAME